MILLGIVTPTLVLSLTEWTPRSSAWVLTTVIAAWAGTQIALITNGATHAPYAFFFWTFVYIFLGLAPTVHILASAVPTTTPDMPVARDWETGIAVLLGLAAFQFGSKLGNREQGLPALETRQVSATRIGFLSLITGITALYFLAKIPISALFESRTALNEARNQAWADPALGAVVFAITVYGSLIVAHAVRWRRSKFRDLSLGERLWLLSFAAIAAFVANPIGNPRYVFGTTAFALLVIFVSPERLRAGSVYLFALAGFIFVFPLADAFRRSSSPEFGDLTFTRQYYNNGDYDAFWQLGNSLSFIDAEGIQYFRQFLGSALFWVPRSFWSEKPIDTGVLLAQWRGYDFTNLSAPVWAELLVNAGWIGLIVGFVVIGRAVASLDRISLAAATPALSAMAGVLPAYTVILLRGSLLQATGGAAVILGMTLFLSGHAKTVHEERSGADSEAHEGWGDG